MGLEVAATMPGKKKGKKGAVSTGQKVKFTIDCSVPVQDGLMETALFEDFLLSRIKVNGKAGVLGDAVSVTRDRAKLHITAQLPFSKRYLKYLTKKYLRKESPEMKEAIRVLATSRYVYELRYRKFDDSDESE